MTEPFLAEIKMFGGNFAPRGYALCNGQVLPIAQNTALFSLLGTTFGGNGQTTFALPDLRGRAPIHWGQGPGLSDYVLGQAGGTETVTLTVNQLPSHTHAAGVTNAAATSTRPNGKVPSQGGAYGDAPDGTSVFHAGHIANTGNSQPHSILQPFLGITYIIALQGVFPSRN